MNVIEEPSEFPPRRYRIALTVGTHSPRHLRRIAHAYLRLWGLPHLSESVELVLTELLTNVHRHVPDRWAELTLLRTDCGVRIEVYDRSPAALFPRTAGAWDESGRGLGIVALLTDKWAVSPASCGKTVWCEITA